ncbi:hypothetical protein KUCAC02_007009 [Chaenocephalus aceratus]|nr:hypothetical protein KUCAC02_007009 [Chaenocephalus aceratus]
MDDIIVPEEKKEMIEKANNEIVRIHEQYQNGHITGEERYSRAIQVWSKTNDDLTDILMTRLEADKDGFNNVFMMADSGARGSRTQIRQLAAMRGLMSKPSGEIIELPIRSNFKEGLSVIEYFISSNGARKGLSDTALKTADAGYLTRRLVDIAQDVVINEEDCGTINGTVLTALKDGEEIVEHLANRISGRFALERVVHPLSSEIIVDMGQEITRETADKIGEIGVESVKVRTVLACEAQQGVCQKCYGRDLARDRTVNIGEAVGTIAAQSIGQPGTQLTMRTFHIGGAASTISEDNKVSLKYPIYIKQVYGSVILLENGEQLFTRKGYLLVHKILRSFNVKKGDEIVIEDGKRAIRGEVLVRQSDGNEIITDEIGYVKIVNKKILIIAQERKVSIRNGTTLIVKEGQAVDANTVLATFDPFTDPIIAEQDGTVSFVEILLGTSLKEEVNEDTGNIERRIMDLSNETLMPRIEIIDAQKEVLGTYYLPSNAYLGSGIENGCQVKTDNSSVRWTDNIPPVNSYPDEDTYKGLGNNELEYVLEPADKRPPKRGVELKDVVDEFENSSTSQKNNDRPDNPPQRIEIDVNVGVSNNESSKEIAPLRDDPKPEPVREENLDSQLNSKMIAFL